MKVTFTIPEYAVIAVIGMFRHINKLKLGRQDVNGAEKEDGWSLDIQGAIGEAALAKALNVWWMGGEFRGIDVGDKFEVRSTRHKNGSLIIREHDKDHLAYFLVVTDGLKAEIKGYMYGKEAKQKRFLKDYNDRKPAYFIPQNQLNPVNNLYKLDTKAA